MTTQKRHEIYSEYKRLCKELKFKQKLKYPKGSAEQYEKLLKNIKKSKKYQKLEKVGGAVGAKQPHQRLAVQNVAFDDLKDQIKYEASEVKNSKKFKETLLKINDTYQIRNVGYKLDLNVVLDANTTITDLIQRLQDHINDIIGDFDNRHNVDGNDLVKITIDGDNLWKEQNTIFKKWRNRNEMLYLLFDRSKAVLASDGVAFVGDLNVNFTWIKIPRGNGVDLRKITHKRRKKGIVCINNDNLCLYRAVVCGIAKITNDRQKKTICDSRKKLQTTKAIELAKKCGCSTELAGSIFDIQKISKTTGYKIVVHDISIGYDLLFKTEGQKCIYLLKNGEHYDLIVKPTVIFGKKYYCSDCNCGYEKKAYHKCLNLCCLCKKNCGNEKNLKTCEVCNKSFKNDQCFRNHLKDCEKSWKCPCCHKNFVLKIQENNLKKACEIYGKTIKNQFASKFQDYHICGMNWCKKCHQYCETHDHKCWINLKIPNDPNDNLIFLDFEASQANGVHIPNYVVAMYACGKTFYFENSGEQIRDDFYEWLFSKKHNGYTIIAHNMRAYDGYFMLQYLTETREKPNIIYSGTKIMGLTLRRHRGKNIRLVDSLNFMPTSLKNLPKQFGYEKRVKKGYFPHYFNLVENWNYEGDLPAIKYYGIENFKENERFEFLNWYLRKKLAFQFGEYKFNFKKEMKEYCENDVEILRLCCLEFRRQFMELSTHKRKFFDEEDKEYFVEKCIDPFTHLTISSASFALQRWAFTENNTIANPKLYKDNFSKGAIIALDFYADKNQLSIQHALNGGEKVLKCETKTGFRYFHADGYISKSKTVIEYYGDYFHGNPEVYDFEDWNRDTSCSFRKLYERTMEREEILRKNGYTVISIWEKDFEITKKTTEFKNWFKTYNRKIFKNLNPRDAFFGGRTNAIKLYHKTEKNEKIRYVDFTSLYPFVCKYAEYPIGHPQILKHNPKKMMELVLKKKVFGIVQCKILPAKLYFPVLPVKQKKLTFPCCNQCAIDECRVCNHTEEQRCLIGTWATPELYKALEMGYILKEVYEIHNFKKRKGLFQKYIDTFLRIKQESSGYPSWVQTKNDKEKYIDDYLKHEGILLREKLICKNPARRQTAKQILNLLWGKYGQRSNFSKHKQIKKPCEFWNMI